MAEARGNIGRVLHVRWLTPRAARAVARLERSSHERAGRAGLRDILFDLRRAQLRGTGLSLGLYDGPRLVGCVLAYLHHDRRTAFEEFEVDASHAATLQGPAVYVEDVMLQPAYRRHVMVLFGEWFRQVRRRHPGVPLDAFCRPALLVRWHRFARGFRSGGYVLADTVQVTDTARHEQWYWLSWRCVPPAAAAPMAASRVGTAIDGLALPAGYEARVVRTEAQWRLLRETWERLLQSMPAPTPFSAFDLNLLWWQHFGLGRQLMIVVLCHHGDAVAIAPLMVSPERRLGRYYAWLQFIGDHTLMERPGLIVHPDRALAPELTWRCVAALHPRWDAAVLYEQPAQPQPHPLRAAAGPGGFIERHTPPLVAPLVRLDRPWAEYLAGRSAAVRKNYRRRLRRLQAAGALQLVEHTGAYDGNRALQTYLGVEARSWKHATGQGVAGRPGHLPYYRALCAALAPSGQVHFRFLYLDDRPIAATFGVLYAGRFASLEICHDRAFDAYSPGVVLTGLELEQCHAREDCSSYDFLSGTPNNKLGWCTEVCATHDIHLLPDDRHGRLAVFVMFCLKPAMKRMLSALGLRTLVMNTLERLRRGSG